MAIKTVAQFQSGQNQAGFAYDDATAKLLYVGFLVADPSYPIYVTYRNRETGQSFTAPAPDGSEIVPVTGLTYDAATGETNFDGSSGTLTEQANSSGAL